jgi:hypothetical protein
VKVEEWNERAIRRHFELVGDHEFLRMERSA